MEIKVSRTIFFTFSNFTFLKSVSFSTDQAMDPRRSSQQRPSSKTGLAAPASDGRPRPTQPTPSTRKYFSTEIPLNL